MKKITFLFLMSVFAVMATFAQTGGEDTPAVPEIEILPNPNDVQTYLSTLTFICNDGIKLSGKEGATLSNPALGITKDLVGWEIMPTMVTLDPSDYSAVREEGNWILRIPEGYFILGPEGATVQNEAITVRFQIATEVPFNLLSATPESKSTLSILEDVLLKFDGSVLSTQLEGIVYNENKDSVTSVTGVLWNKEGTWFDDYSLLRVVLTDSIVAAGTYTIFLPEGFAKRSTDEKLSSELSFVYTVDGSLTSIEQVKSVTDENVIYDLIGRRVENISSPGIYIVNGKKVFVK